MNLRPLKFLDRDRLEKVDNIDENGEFVNYPRRTHIDYYGIRGRIIGDGIIIRETKYIIKSFDMDYAPLVCIDRIIIRNIEGLNKVISTECTINANEETINEQLTKNKKSLDALYSQPMELVSYIKNLEKRDELRKKYKVKVMNYYKKDLDSEDEC